MIVVRVSGFERLGLDSGVEHRHHFGDLRPLRPAVDTAQQARAFAEGVYTRALQCRDVQESVDAFVFRDNKPKTLRIVEPFQPRLDGIIPRRVRTLSSFSGIHFKYPKKIVPLKIGGFIASRKILYKIWQ